MNASITFFCFFCFRRRLFHALLGIPLGGFAILNGCMTTYTGFVIVTVLFGLVEGGFHSQRATIVSEFVDKKQMASTVGYVIAFQGIGNMLGPPVGGKQHSFWNSPLGYSLLPFIALCWSFAVIFSPFVYSFACVGTFHSKQLTYSVNGLSKALSVFIVQPVYIAIG